MRVAPPPPGATRLGEGVVLCVLVIKTEPLALGQLLAVIVMSAVRVMWGEPLPVRLTAGERDALEALASAEEVVEREGREQAVLLRVAAGGVRETRALAV